MTTYYTAVLTKKNKATYIVEAKTPEEAIDISKEKYNNVWMDVLHEGIEDVTCTTLKPIGPWGVVSSREK